MTTIQPTVSHTPVMVDEVLRALAVQPGGRYVDCTVGGGGHAEAILEAASPGGLLLGIDADPHALQAAHSRLARFGDAVLLVEGNFRDVASICRSHGFAPVHGVLFDLGLSSLQLAEEGRGFSFQAEAPLDMRFSPQQAITAADIVNTYPEESLANLLWRYGQEPHSRRIARRIVRERPLETTTQLAKTVQRALGRGHLRLHPATRTFQALRIAVNQELENLSAALEGSCDLLGYSGRLVVISFHSLEDAIVKNFFRQESRDCICPPDVPTCRCNHKARLRLVKRGAVRPTPAEVAANPRCRSARLRAAERL
ncbi:MAG: 16S rRNA (cytosine(1402)-N(4))-methyltransferase RsmH [Dehalococcoidia bacterium]